MVENTREYLMMHSILYMCLKHKLSCLYCICVLYHINSVEHQWHEFRNFLF